MKTSDRIQRLSFIVLALLVGCAYQAPPPPPYTLAAMAAGPGSPYDDLPPLQPTSFQSVNSYKSEVAAHIMRSNSEHTFSGRLPPMLPAIVVLTITVDQDGRMTRLAVQRSRDDDASEVAMASMRRSGNLPKPYNLVAGENPSLTFSETFLFNKDYQFQLRTLAGVQ